MLEGIKKDVDTGGPDDLHSTLIMIHEMELKWFTKKNLFG